MEELHLRRAPSTGCAKPPGCWCQPPAALSAPHWPSQELGRRLQGGLLRGKATSEAMARRREQIPT